MVELVCLACGQPLNLSGASWITCQGCGLKYSQTLGIPDLRGSESIDSETDQALVKQMVDCYLQTTYAELLDIRLRGAPTYADLIGHERGYHLVALGDRGQKMTEMFQTGFRKQFGPLPPELALDLGCGSGASLIALAGRYRQVVGVDPSLPDLILARKALEAAKVVNVQLVQAYGQHLPFPNQIFTYVNALNVLEHVFDLLSVLREAYRVLQPGGGFGADSRNRLDIFLPEPHVKLRWVGLWPRRWAPAYVRWRRGVGYSSTHLLSYADLQRGLRQTFGSQYRITFPSVSAYGSASWVDAWLARLERLPLIRELMLWIFPSHLVVAQRQ